MSRPLYNIAAEYAALLDAPDDVDVTAALDAIGDELERKATNIAFMLRDMESETDAIKVEEDRLYMRRKAHERRCEKLAEYLRANMERAGIRSVKHALFTITLRQSNGKVVVHDVDAVPDAYKHPPKPREVDKAAVKDAVKRGEAVPGCSVEYEPTLSIR